MARSRPGTQRGGQPVLVHTFENMVSGIVEAEPDVFIVTLSDAYTTHESHLARVDLNSWTPAPRCHRRSSTPSTTGSAA